MYFYPHLYALEKTSQSVTHPKITLSQVHLTPEFFVVGFLEKKVYPDGISILSILLSLESECHNRSRAYDQSHVFRPKSRIRPELRLPIGVGHTTGVAPFDQSRAYDRSIFRPGSSIRPESRIQPESHIPSESTDTCIISMYNG
jgi:hypothetical protein